MTIPCIETFPTANAKIVSRKGEASLVKRFTFKNPDGTDHDITGYGFEYSFFQTSTLNTLFFKLIVGSGLAIVDTNKLDIYITKAQSTRPVGNYFSQLKDTANDHSWTVGPWELISGVHKRRNDDSEIVVYLNGGDEVLITVETVGGGSSSGFAAELDASLGFFPDGFFGAADEVKVIEGGFIDGIPVGAGSIMKAMQDNPTSDWNAITGWKVI